MATAAYLNHDAVVETQYGETYPKSRLAPRRAFLNTYRCKDGKWITITIPGDFGHYFTPLLRALGREDLVGDPRWTRIEDTMFEKAPQVVGILDEAFAKLTQDEAVAALNRIDAPVARVQSTEEFMADPQALANRCFYQLEASDPPAPDRSDILVPASPVKFNDLDSGVVGNRRGPKLGEHTVEILRQYGYSQAEIAALLEQNVVSQAKK